MFTQPRSQGLSSYRPLERTRKESLSSFAPGGGKMKYPGNEVGVYFGFITRSITKENNYQNAFFDALLRYTKEIIRYSFTQTKQFINNVA